MGVFFAEEGGNGGGGGEIGHADAGKVGPEVVDVRGAVDGQQALEGLVGCAEQGGAEAYPHHDARCEGPAARVDAVPVKGDGSDQAAHHDGVDELVQPWYHGQGVGLDGLRREGGVNDDRDHQGRGPISAYQGKDCLHMYAPQRYEILPAIFDNMEICKSNRRI